MISLEQLTDGSPSARNFEKLAALVLDTGGQSVGIRFGVSSVTFTASAASAEQTIPHGLGRVPIGAWINYFGTVGSTIVASLPVTALDATNLKTSGKTSVAISASIAIYWVVIG